MSLIRRRFPKGRGGSGRPVSGRHGLVFTPWPSSPSDRFAASRPAGPASPAARPIQSKRY